MIEKYVRMSDVVQVLTNNRVHFGDLVKMTSDMKALETFEVKNEESVLDEIRAELEKLDGMYVIRDHVLYMEKIPKYEGLWCVRLDEVINILDKYKEGEEG